MFMVKTYAAVYLTELDAPPQQRVVNHREGYYFLGAGRRCVARSIDALA